MAKLLAPLNLCNLARQLWFSTCAEFPRMFQVSWNVLIFLKILPSRPVFFPNRPVVYLVDENVVYENYWSFIVFFSSLQVFYLFLPSPSKSGLWKKRGKLVLLNSMKNFYEKCHVKIDENWWKKHTPTNNLSKKNDSIDWKLIWWKLDKIGLELVKNMRWFEKIKCGSRSCTLWTTHFLEQLFVNLSFKNENSQFVIKNHEVLLSQ